MKRHGAYGWVFVFFSLTVLMFVSVQFASAQFASAQFASAQADKNIIRVIFESAPPHLDNHISTARLTTTVTDPINVFLVTQNEKLEILDVPAYIDRVFVNKDFDLTVVGDSSFGDPDYLLRQYFLPDGESNVTGYNNPDIAMLIEEGAALSDSTKRKAIYDQVYPVIQHEASLVYLVQEVRHGAMKQPLTGVIFKPNNTYVFDQATFGSEVETLG